MATFEEKFSFYQEEATKLGFDIDSDLLSAVTKSLGPSIHLNDASLVSSSDQSELDRVKNNFLIGKLGLEDGPGLDEAISEVAKAFGPGNGQKHRALFYALLVKKFGKESLFA
jgi:hypothetical protein